jgi:polyhydroxybutyrate depolymerase
VAVSAQAGEGMHILRIRRIGGRILLVFLVCALTWAVLDAKQGAPRQEYSFSLFHGGLRRSYTVHLPPGYRRRTPLPVIIAFHGGGGTAEGTVSYYALNGKADSENFIVVYPQGTGKKILGKVFGSWNGGRCCPPASRNNVDDVGFVAQMLDELSNRFSVDPKRIYAVGFSNGALMCYRLACELSDRIAAIAVGGAVDAFDGCAPKRPVPVLHFHGTLDKCGFYNGGICGGCFADYLVRMGLPADRRPSQWVCRSVPAFMEEWSRRNGCRGEKKVVYRKGQATCISYGTCRNNAEVVLCTLAGGGHTWPGGNNEIRACEKNENSYACSAWKEGVGESSRDLDADTMLWEFFKAHPKQ